MTNTSIDTVTDTDTRRAIAVMVLAFGADPLMRWIYPDPYAYLTGFPDFIRKFTGKGFDHKTAYHLHDFAGVTLWRPPGVEPEKKEIVSLLQRAVPRDLQNDLFNLFGQTGRYRPNKPYWHLSFIGIDPNRQHRGLGSRLIEHTLLTCDHDKKPAYLNASNPWLIPFYQRHGFQLLDTIQAGSSPPIFPMLRKPH
uniref:Acetyltransferase (GNAT) domain-containing protein n=1 Tax=Candidatus Kentrum sp. MB TaxID=2138164 RepID=A0A451BBU0_9GAMM|nr:MAG: Acetyltransferase (GNAT) domain-containing protein [Candidatus Kentron sp. MB]VFK30935.1 MAG: Acetyltransferase (GNAT) domain-containing protein [Candidatus Kentron sp. MB]VFK75729.1 MAG: Acetyltransferase (GNAT) domain-containing protein [Candidatus Kentron sp. MB]